MTVTTRAFRLALFLPLLAVSLPAFATKTEAITPPDIDAVTTLDEVVVTGDRTLFAARQALIEAEDRFYARWNVLNDDKRFDVHCSEETPHDHPSRIVRRICQPGFIAQLEQVESDRVLTSILGTASSQGGVVSVASMQAEQSLLREEMKKRTLAMINRDPELKRALLERARLEQHFEALRREKFKDRWIVWK